MVWRKWFGAVLLFYVCYRAQRFYFSTFAIPRTVHTKTYHFQSSSVIGPNLNNVGNAVVEQDGIGAVHPQQMRALARATQIESDAPMRLNFHFLRFCQRIAISNWVANKKEAKEHVSDDEDDLNVSSLRRLSLTHQNTLFRCGSDSQESYGDLYSPSPAPAPTFDMEKVLSGLQTKIMKGVSETADSESDTESSDENSIGSTESAYQRWLATDEYDYENDDIFPLPD